MGFDKNFIPVKPFNDFKWQWASVQCTEGLNDPVILLGVLSKMANLEGKKYSSSEFSRELYYLHENIKDSVDTNIRLSERDGTRNIIRNSGQYWKALGLIDDSSRGIIKLTPFGKKIALHDISQAEFAATTIKTLKLPNSHIQSNDVCNQWHKHDLCLYPLMVILNILLNLSDVDQEGDITTKELTQIIIPLSGVRAKIDDYVNFILWNRNNELDISEWPDCCPRANDKRMAREFLLFLQYYGYIKGYKDGETANTKYYIVKILSDDIRELLKINKTTSDDFINQIRENGIISDIERKRVLASRIDRKGQRKFRSNILKAFNNKCLLTGVSIPEVLEAAHIKPVQYKGNDETENGLCLRLDIHQLFDTGHLRISESGNIILSQRVCSEYGTIIKNSIDIPDFINKQYIKWRWDNYNGI